MTDAKEGPTAAGHVRGRLPSERVDKYFGDRLPPVCARLGCWRSDDGKRYYCVNPTCHKDRRRETKHTRVNRPKHASEIAFRCPRCGQRDVDVRDWGPRYACRACNFLWDP